MKLTQMERRVLGKLWDSAEGNDHDFGFTYDARSAVEQPRQLAAMIRNLQAKGVLAVHEKVRNEAGTFRQFTWEMQLENVRHLMNGGTVIVKKRNQE